MTFLQPEPVRSAIYRSIGIYREKEKGDFYMKYYTPEELVGKKVVLVYNLKPAKLCGIESQGMLLCAEKDGKVCLISPEKDMPSGSTVR